MLGRHVAELMARLPGRLIVEDSPHATESAARAAKVLEPVFAELMKRGFVLELRGTSNGVNRMMLAVKGPSATEQSWSRSYVQAANCWFANGTNLASSLEWQLQENGRSMRVWQTNAWLMLEIAEMAPVPGIQKGDLPRLPGEAVQSKTNPVLSVEMAPFLLPHSIRRAEYGNFARFHFQVAATDQGFKVQGAIHYDHDLPAAGSTLVVPTKIIGNPTVSFTAVRSPDHWVAPGSGIRDFLPVPIPQEIYFWGTAEAPFCFFAAGRLDQEEQQMRYVRRLAPKLQELANQADAGNVTTAPDGQELFWQGMPFVTPNVKAIVQDNIHYAVAGLAPQAESTNSFPKPLLQRIEQHPNLVLYDWEFTSPRLTGWLYISQLALMLSHSQQLSESSPSLKWILAVQHALPEGGNTVTEITQTGPRELSFERRASLGFTSAEIIWLANWLESSNFPAANFVMPTKTGL